MDRRPPIKPVDLVVIGDSPITSDFVEKKPFSGPGGTLLRKGLLRAGLTKSHSIHLTHALSCLTPRGKNTDKKAIAACRPSLQDEVSAAAPKLILALGTAALHAITGDHSLKITKVAGQKFETPYGTVIPCLHPAAVMRSPQSYGTFQAALDVVGEELLGLTKYVAGTSRYAIVREPEFEYVVEVLRKQPYLAADIETEGFDPRTRKILVLGIAIGQNRTLIFKPDMIPRLKPLFEDPEITWVWHNGKFDVKFLRHLGIQARVDEDTMLMHYALDETKGTHDLEQLAARYLNVPPYEHKIREHLDKEWGYRYAPPKLLNEYLAKDCDYTWQLYRLFRKQLDAVEPLSENDRGLAWLYDTILKPAASFLGEVEARGIWVNREVTGEAGRQLEAEKAALEEAIVSRAAAYWDPRRYAADTGAKTAPEQFNPGSSNQLRWLLYDRMKLRPKSRIRGKLSTRQEVLQELDDPTGIVEHLLKLRSVSKLLSTYVYGLEKHLDDDDRIRSTYNIHGTETGRLSSSDPNLQNIPRGNAIKRFFQVPRDRYFIEVDYSQAELRVLAVLSGDEFLKRVYVEGRDLHDEVSLAMFGPNYTEEQRVKAKAINFGIAYGLKGSSLEATYKMRRGEGDAMIRAWYDRMPDAERFIKNRRADVANGNTIYSPFGRRRRFRLVTRGMLDELQNQGVNHPIQATASDLTLLSGIYLQPRLTSRWGAYIVNLVHDSILIDAPRDAAALKEIATLVEKVMVQIPRHYLKTDIPFKVDFKSGESWGDLREGVELR